MDFVKEIILLICVLYILLVFLFLWGWFLFNIVNLFGFCYFCFCLGFVSFIFVIGEGYCEVNVYFLKLLNFVIVMFLVFNLCSFCMDFWNIG